MLLVALLLSLLVTACADQESQRRFANEPLPTVDLASLAPTASPVASSPVVTPNAAPALVSPEALLVARGAPKVFYVQAGPKLLAFPSNGGKPAVVLTTTAEKIVSYDASPSGDRVSVLLRYEKIYSVVILDATGKRLAEWDKLDQLIRVPKSTSGDAQPAGRDLIDWSPQGDRLLVTFATGGIVALPLRGDPVVLVSSKEAPGPIDAAWSPAGDSIAFVNRASTQSSAGLFVMSTTTKPFAPRPLIAPEAGNGPSVRRLAWYPSGTSILYTRSSSPNGLPIGGDLFRISPAGGGPTIVASAGRVAPISAIVDFAPSPDGRAVAYTIATPGPNGPVFNSLWIQQLGTPNRLKLPAASDTAVNELWWVSSGLIWRSSPDPSLVILSAQDGPFTLHSADKDGAVTPIYQFQPPAATPIASPAASPEASPAASPRAASPAATPIANAATPAASPSPVATPRSTPAQ